MGIEMKIKVNGRWHTASPWVRVGSVWKQVKSAWTKVNGKWEKFHGNN